MNIIHEDDIVRKLHYYTTEVVESTTDLPMRGQLSRLLCGPPPYEGAEYCVALCLSVCPSVPLLFLFTFFTVEPSYERTSKIEKLLFSLMGQRHVCTFRHAQRAAYRTAISAAQTC